MLPCIMLCFPLHCREPQRGPAVRNATLAPVLTLVTIAMNIRCVRSTVGPPLNAVKEFESGSESQTKQGGTSEQRERRPTEAARHRVGRHRVGRHRVGRRGFSAACPTLHASGPRRIPAGGAAGQQ